MDDRAAQIAALLLPLERLPDPLPVPVIQRPFDVVIRPPGSKSLTNRALLLAALADGVSELRGALVEADDARVMVRAVEMLGARVEIESAKCKVQSANGEPAVTVVRVTGVGGRWKIPAGKTVTLDLHNAGTATRFLTAAAVLAPADCGGIIIDGDVRMRERPIGELVEALRQLEARVTYLGKEGCPPLKVEPMPALGSRPTLRFASTKSSQYLSALLLVAPCLESGLSVEATNPITSPSYIFMSLGVLYKFGAHRKSTEIPGGWRWTIEPGLRASSLDIEPDASGATYPMAAALLVPESSTTIDGLTCDKSTTIQGDSQFWVVLEAAGALPGPHRAAFSFRGPRSLRPFDAKLGDMPDTAMTAAVLACFASPTTENPTATSVLRGLRTLRVKETDRIEALRKELTKIGAKVEVFREGDDEGIRITPLQHWSAQSDRPVPPAHFETYNDHRMAMALALVGLRRPGVFIRDPGCVRKTYPTFWRDLAKLYQ